MRGETLSSTRKVNICCHKLFLDFSTDFRLHVDTPKDRLGCPLYQKQENQLRIKEYGIKNFVGAENCYHSFKLEYLELKWAVSITLNLTFTMLNTVRELENGSLFFWERNK